MGVTERQADDQTEVVFERTTEVKPYRILAKWRRKWSQEMMIDMEN